MNSGVLLNEEKELVEKFLSGDKNAFNIIGNKYIKQIYWYARRMLGNHDDADEITQQVLMVLFNKLSTFKFQSELRTWIFRITSNRCLNLIRKNKLKKIIGLDDALNIADNSNDIIRNLVDKENVEIVVSQLQKLPPKQREVFVMKNFNNMKYEEISAITGKSVGALKANYFHAIKKITEMVNDHEK